MLLGKKTAKRLEYDKKSIFTTWDFWYFFNIRLAIFVARAINTWPNIFFRKFFIHLHIYG